MDSRLSSHLIEDLSFVTENGLRQSLDDHTVCITPRPLAASTVVRPRDNVKSRDPLSSDPRGSFINTTPTMPPQYDRDFEKLTFSGSNGSDKSESRKSEETGCNDVSARSSLGLIHVEAMNDLSSSALLINNLSTVKPAQGSNMTSTNQQSTFVNRLTPSYSQQQSSLNGQSTADSNDWRDSSKQDSKNHAIGSSHVMDTVKKRPESNSVVGGKGNQHTAVAMSLFSGGILGDVSEGCEMDASIHDVQFEADELQLLDEDFSDLEEVASTDDEEFGASGFKVQKTLTDDDKLGVNNEDGEDDIHEESVEDRHGAVGEESWNLDQKYFRVSPAVYSTGERRELPGRQNFTQNTGDWTGPSLNLLGDSDERYCDGEGSETDDEPNGSILTRNNSQQSYLREAGLVGQTSLKSVFERQSGEGEVSDSPDSSAVGGVGLGDGSSGPESDDGNPRVPTSKTTTPHRFAQPHTTSNLDLYPGEERQRPMGNDLLTESHMTNRYQTSVHQPVSYMTEDDSRLNDGRTSQGNDFLLQSQFFAETNQSEITTNQSMAPLNNSSFHLEDILNGTQEESSYQREGERMGAFGFNAADLPQGNDPFSNFNSSFGSFGLKPNAQDDKNDESIQSGHNETWSSNQKPDAEIRKSNYRTSSSQLASSKLESDFNKPDRRSSGKHNTSSKFQSSSSSSRLQDTAAAKSTNRKSSTSLHRSESLPKDKRTSGTLPEAKCRSDNVHGARNPSGGLIKPLKDTPRPQQPSKHQKDPFTKMPVPISSIGQASKSRPPVNHNPVADIKKSEVAPLPPSQTTNLAFHMSFNEEAVKQKEMFDRDFPADDEFRSTEDAILKMFEEDEKEFNKENIFSQHDNMSESVGPSQDAQWAYRSVMSQSHCTVPNDPWSRLSVGEYWAHRTENLGTLEGNPDLPRPEFGMKIKTPPNNRKPFPLFKTANTSPMSDIGNKSANSTKDLNDKSVVSDMTFTLSDLDTPQQQKVVKKTPQLVQPQTPAEVNQTSASEVVDSPKSKDNSVDISVLTNSLLNLEQSLCDQSGVLSVSTISSFISKISTQSNAAELVNTIMALSQLKSKAKDSKTETLVAMLQKEQEKKAELSSKEDTRPEKPDRQSKLPVRRGSTKDLLRKSLKSQGEKETPSPPSTRTGSLPTRPGSAPTSIPSSFEKSQKQNGDKPSHNLSDSYADDNEWDRINQPDRDTGDNVNQSKEFIYLSPIKNEASQKSTEWRSPRPSMGGRQCVLSDTQARSQFQTNFEKNAFPMKIRNEKVDEFTSEGLEQKRTSRRSYETGKSDQNNRPLSPPAREADTYTSINGDQRKSLRTYESEVTNPSEDPWKVVNEDEKTSIQYMENDRASFHPLPDRPSDRFQEYQHNQNTHTSSRSHTANLDFHPVDSTRTVHADHHIPDGSDYSSRSNYFSPDKELSRDLAVGTDDIRLSDSRGYNFLHSKDKPNEVDIESRTYSPPVQEKQDGKKQQTSVPIFHHNLLPNQQPEKPTLLTDKSLLSTQFAKQYLPKESQQAESEFKVPFPVKSKANETMPQDSFYSDETSFYELQAQNLSRMSHVMSESHPSFMSQTPSYQSTPFKRDGLFDSLPLMTPSYMKSVLSTGPIDRRLAETHLDTSGVLMATPKQLTQLEVPSVFTFPESSCVGISLSANLPISNPTSRWQECSLIIKDLSINNQPVDPDKHSPFELKCKVIIEPNSTEHISVMFLPRIPGAFVAQLLIYAKPFLRDVVVPPCRIPVEVTLQAIAEKPNIQVITKEDRMVYFGQLAYGSCRMSSIQLRNLNKGSVPVRLTITNVKSSSWHCFSFDKDITSPEISLCSTGSRPMSPVFGKNAMSLSLEGYGDRRSSSIEEIKIYCKPPRKQSDRALSLCPPELFEAQVNVEIDTNIPNIPPITSVVLKAEVGMVKLHTPIDLDKIKLSSVFGKKCAKSFKLKNAGNIGMEVSLFVPQFSDIFPVTPRFLTIPACQEREVTVNFDPKDKNICTYDTLLLMGLEPDGPTYEIPVQGELIQAVAPPAGPLLLSDKHALPFGGVALGRAKQLRVTLKSNAHQALKLRVEIRSSSNTFQFQLTSNQSSSGSLHRDVIIQPQEKFPVYVVYSPSRVETSSGKLVIKPYDCNAKFSISLSGYGGVSSVTLKDVHHSGTSRFWLDVGEVSLGSSDMHNVSVTNTGHRAAFVKAISFTDLQLKQTLPPGRIAIDPSEFILSPKETKSVHIAFCPSDREVAACYREKEVVATVAFYHGDEVSRQKYRRAINKPLKPGKKSHKVHIDQPLQKVNFDVSYYGDLGEKVVSEGYGVNDSDSDIDLFYSNLAHISLALIGHPVVKLETCTPQVYPKTRRSHGEVVKSDYPTNNRSSLQSDNRQQPYSSQHPGEKDCDWSVLPQQLICNVNRDGKQTQSVCFQIINFSTKDIKYEMSWPGHWFTVSPEHGIVKAKSNIMVTIAPHTNLNLSKLPWSGAVVVCCNEQFEEVKVQLRSELTYEPDIPTSDSTESCVVPVSKDIDKYLQVPNTHFVFSKTFVGDHSGKMLEFTNTSNDTITWSINSFAPAYARGIDSTSDVYRVTYSVFVFKEKTGRLLPHQTAQVSP
ncbi:hypothetical protein SNE40_008063 [Patella caerulea]|uniref:Centrosomal protein of 192 kDa n=1 Tax=Patella caerulea TaxID=87958 RepID=A0AAN8K0E2_PATCE